MLSNLLVIVSLATKRLITHIALVACVAVGLVAAVALVSGLPLYADAVNYRLFHEQLRSNDLSRYYRPPFAFMWRRIGAWHGAVDWETYQPVDAYLTEQAPGALGLPLIQAMRHVKTDNLGLFPGPGNDLSHYYGRKSLSWVSLGFISDLEPHIQLLEGAMPRVASPGHPVEVLVSQTLADKLGLQVGEDYLVFRSGAGRDQVQLPVRVAGVWRAANPADPYWFYAPQAFDEVLLIPEASFTGVVAPAMKDEVYLALWYLICDGSGVRTADVPSLLARVATVQATAASILSHTSLDASPVDALRKYRQATQRLTILLAVFSVPALGLLLYFIALVSGMVVRRGQNEIAVLRSRGASRVQIVGLYLLEGGLLGLVALAVGPLASQATATLVGQARSFLDFSGGSSLPVVTSTSSLGFAALAVVLAILTSVLPALGAARHTVVSYKQEVARALGRPWWQRYLVDFLLLIPPAYGYYQLQRRGTITLLGRGLGGDPFENPLLFLVPALACFALALVFIRIFPRVTEALAWLVARLPGVSLLLALRHLARTPGAYTGPLLLLILTLSLAAFTASMAVTLDHHLSDQVYYQVGADLSLAELGESTEVPQEPGAPRPARPESEGPKWLFLPVSEHLLVPGVRAAARVGDYAATARLGDRPVAGRFLGVDRVDFPQVAFWRWDFADQPLGGLVNALALDAASLLVSRGFLAQHGLGLGDRLILTVDVFGERRQIAFNVAGVLDLFPTHYPEDGPLFVGNLDYIFEQIGGQYPYDVWLSIAEDADPATVVQGVRVLGFRVVSADDARARILAEQRRPERQGLFGFLTVGFVAAALVTVLGFLLFAVLSFQRRFIELGVLRAVGLSRGQMTVFLAVEQATLIGMGLLVGTGLGVLASQLFIPFLQVGAGKAATTPPFIVRIAWPEIITIYGLFAAMFALAVLAMGLLLARMRLFEAVKLGEIV